MDTLKSLAVVTLLGAVLYGVYVVASKPDKPLPEGMAEMVRAADALLHREGGPKLDPPEIEAPPSHTNSHDHAVPHDHAEPHDHAAPWPSPADGNLPKPDSASASPYRSREGVAPPPSPHFDPPEPEGRATGFETPVVPQQDEIAPPESPDFSAEPNSANDDAEIAAAQQRIRVYAFHQAWKTAQEQAEDERYREALLALSPFYNDTAIAADEHEQLVGWLDALAAKVVYSTEHLLEPAYVVSRNETLFTISEKYRVPYPLLKNINGVRDPNLLIAGTKLKVVPGPFHAEVDLGRQEITVFVQNLYAGRFAFTRGDEPVRAGEYTVLSMDMKKNYAGVQGVIPANDPRNPYGGVWANLGNEVSIHGSPAEAYSGQKLGCIGLAQRDAEDLLAILSIKESRVTVKD